MRATPWLCLPLLLSGCFYIGAKEHNKKLNDLEGTDGTEELPAEILGLQIDAVDVTLADVCAYTGNTDVTVTVSVSSAWNGYNFDSLTLTLGDQDFNFEDLQVIADQDEDERTSFELKRQVDLSAFGCEASCDLPVSVSATMRTIEETAAGATPVYLSQPPVVATFIWADVFETYPEASQVQAPAFSELFPAGIVGLDDPSGYVPPLPTTATVVACIPGADPEVCVSAAPTILDYDPDTTDTLAVVLFPTQEIGLLACDTDLATSATWSWFLSIPSDGACVTGGTMPFYLGDTVALPSGDCDGDTHYVFGEAPDCDDTNELVHPGAAELCGLDLDCDLTFGNDEEGEPPIDATYYLDADGDGHPGLDAPTECTPSATSLELTTAPTPEQLDCDDDDLTYHPGAAEYCDGDHDCDGSSGDAEVGLPPVDGTFTYPDADQDGSPETNILTVYCNAPIGVVPLLEAPGDDELDCDDTNPDAHPALSDDMVTLLAVPEVCDGVDNDCDTDFDEGVQVTIDGTNFASLTAAMPEVGSGDTVHICLNQTGSWNVPAGVTFQGYHNADLIGAPDSEGTLINLVGPGDVTFVDLKLRGGTGFFDPNNGRRMGGCIFAPEGRVILDHTTVRNCTADDGYGGGIFANIVEMSNGSEVINNSAASGGGILARTAAILRDPFRIGENDAVSDNNQLEPGWRSGGGIAFEPGATLTVESDGLVETPGVIEENYAQHIGGGVFGPGSQNAPFRITGGWFFNNEAGFGGGGIATVQAVELSGMTVENNRANVGLGNSAGAGGGGLYLQEASGRIFDLRALGNTALAGTDGGALRAGLVGDLEIETLSVRENEAWSGGGMFIVRSPLAPQFPVPELDIVDAVIYDNHANDTVGGIKVEDLGVYFEATTIQENTSESHIGGVQIRALGAANGDAEWENVLVDANTSGAGADVGGAYVEMDLTATGLTVRNNHSDRDGAGLVVNYGTVVLIDPIIEDNEAVAAGGGIGAIGTADVDVRNGQFRRNSATTGAAILVNGSNPPGATASCSSCGFGTDEDSNVNDTVANETGTVWTDDVLPTFCCNDFECQSSNFGGCDF